MRRWMMVHLVHFVANRGKILVVHGICVWV